MSILRRTAAFVIAALHKFYFKISGLASGEIQRAGLLGLRLRKPV